MYKALFKYENDDVRGALPNIRINMEVSIQNLSHENLDDCTRHSVVQKLIRSSIVRTPISIDFNIVDVSDLSSSQSLR